MQVAPPNHGSFSGPHIHGTRVPSGGAGVFPSLLGHAQLAVSGDALIDTINGKSNCGYGLPARSAVYVPKTCGVLTALLRPPH